MKNRVTPPYTHFIYVLSIGTTPIYVGCSMNPGRRLYAHKGFPWGILNSIDFYDLSKISINILERVQSHYPKVCGRHATREQYWIKYYLEKGSPILNGTKKTYEAVNKFIYRLFKKHEKRIVVPRIIPPRKVKRYMEEILTDHANVQS